MKNIPKKIYLQHGLSDEELKGVDFKEFNKHGSMSWCADQIEKNDICYILESEVKNKELIEVGLKITKHIISNANTLTNRALLKLCSEFNLKTNEK